VLNGTFVKRKDPSLPVVAVRLYPLTGYETSTVAPATAPPDASFTTPSIDPEFPNCARAGIAPKHKFKKDASNAKLLKLFNIIFSVPNGRCGLVDQGRRLLKN
jgi:hypothetical protein